MSRDGDYIAPSFEVLKDNFPYLDTRFTQNDFKRALEIRTQLLSTLDQHPVYNDLVATLKNAETLAPPAAVSSSPSSSATAAASGGNNHVDPNASSSSSSSCCSVPDRSKNAMEALRSNLNSIRSARPTPFKESVPPNETESRIHGQISFDGVNQDVLESGGPKTAVTVTVKPLHVKASLQRRKQLLEGTSLILNFDPASSDPSVSGRTGPEDSEDLKRARAGEADVVIQGRLKLKSSCSEADANKIIEFFKILMPWDAPAPKREKEEKEEKEGNNNKKQQTFTPRSSIFDFKLQTVGEDRFVVITMVLRRDPKDPIEKMLSNLAVVVTRCYRTDPFAMEAAESLPQFARLGTLRVELQKHLSEWFAKDNANWSQLLEGCRIAFDVIGAPDGFTQLFESELAKELLTDETRRLMKQLLPLLNLPSFVKNASVDLKMTPPELSTAQQVKETAHAARRWYETYTSWGSSSDDDYQVKDKLFGTGCEDVAASFLTSFLRLGATSSWLKDRAHQFSGLVGLVGDAATPAERRITNSEFFNFSRPQGALITSLLVENLVSNLDTIESVNVVAHTLDAKLELQGFDSKIWEDWFVKTRQEAVARCRPIVLANSHSWTSETPDPIFLTTRLAEPGTLFGLSSNGFAHEKYKVLTERIVKPLHSSTYSHPNNKIAAILTQSHKRNSCFTVAVITSLDKKENETARDFLRALGVTFFDLDEEGHLKRLFKPMLKRASGESELAFAYVRRGDRFIRFVLQREHSLTFPLVASEVDAMIFLNTPQDSKTWFAFRQEENDGEGKKASSSASDDDDQVKRREIANQIHSSVAFVSTKSGLDANEKELGKIPHNIFVPISTTYRQVSLSSSSSSSSINETLDWLIENSHDPKRGKINEYKPSCAFDLPIEDELTSFY